MKVMYLIAPSEWKKIGWEFKNEKTTFPFSKPLEISTNAREVDLKCKWERYKEWIKLNSTIDKWPFMKAIDRYTWVVFNNIDYENMSDSSKKFFEENVYILSWEYWILKPNDIIWNYKLPIETKWLYDFWWDKIVKEIAKINPDYVVNLLPDSYAKLIWIGKCSKLKKKRDLYLSWNTKIVNVNFFHEKKWEMVKISHWVKKYRWQFIKMVCDWKLINYEQFWWEVINNWNIIDIKIIN